MKGRKPTPTDLRVLWGNSGKRALPKDDPILLYAPKDLTLEAKKAWPQFSKPLAEAGITTVLDLAALRLLVETYSMWQKATLALQSEGLTYESKDIQRVGPWFRIQASSAELMLRLLAEFGMTPSSRTRVQRGSPPPNPDAVDLFGF
jgi:P27 family predicted phage terminase small subunit